MKLWGGCCFFFFFIIIIISLFWEDNELFKQEFSLCVLLLFGCLVEWVVTFLCDFIWLPSHHLFTLFSNPHTISMIIFYKYGWNYVTYVRVDENLTCASGSTLLKRSRVLPMSVCLHASDATCRCQDVWLVPFLCALASHGLEVLGATIAPIVPRKALTADSAVAGRTGAFVSGGGRTGVSWEHHRFLSCKSRPGPIGAGSELDAQVHIHPVRVAATPRRWSSTQNYTFFACTCQFQPLISSNFMF